MDTAWIFGICKSDMKCELRIEKSVSALGKKNLVEGITSAA